MSRSSESNLPLFHWQPPPKVVLFPMARRLGKIRHTASKLSSKHGADADLYWKQVVASLDKSLTRLDISEVEKVRQIEEFSDAVACEILRLEHTGQRPGGIA